MRKIHAGFLLLSAIMFGAMLFGCGSGNSSGTSSPADQTTLAAVSAIDGAALYNSDCSGCHGALATSSKTGATAAMIQTGILNNSGGMGQLASLGTAEIEAIAIALGTTPAPALALAPAPTPIDGSAWYAADCSGCHGALAASSQMGATAVMIQAAILGNYGSMGQFASLTAAQLQAIATALALASTPPPASINGSALYATDCSGCHGSLAASSKMGATAAMIQTGIVGNYGGMGQLASLTTAQIQAIAAALATTSTPPASSDGAALYTNNCNSCHGALAGSGIAGATASQIQSAISNNSGGMGKFASFTTAQLQTIATALATTSTPPASSDGAALYTNNCSSCHSALANTSVGGASASEIRSAISNNKGGMGKLSSLTTAQIQTISDTLAQQTQGNGDGGDD
jgi:mono/diheme cytochrome c family protein